MLYFDDIDVGFRRHIGSWQVTRSEIVEVATRWDPQPFHIDEAAARASAFGSLVASSVHVFAICTRLFFDWPERVAVLAMLGKDEVRLPNPARPDDVLHYETECVARRQSASRRDRGVVTLSDRMVNQNGEPVLTQRVTLLVAARPAS